MSRTVERLPRGRHGLSREDVVATQRRRILQALADAMVEKGYAGTAVADVLRRAGVSRETFYEQFSSKEDCYLAAFDAAVHLLLDHIPAPAAETDPPIERFSQLFRLYLDTIIAEPAFARVYLLEVHAVGPEAMRRRAEHQQRFVDLLVDIFGGDDDPRRRFAFEMVVAGVASIVTSRLAVLDLDGIAALHRPVVELVGRLTGTAH